MAKWYRYNGVNWNYYVGRGSLTCKCYTTPYKVNDILYGLDEPVHVFSDLWTGVKVGAISLYLDSSAQTFAGRVFNADPQSGDTFYRTGFPFLLKCEDDVTLTDFTQVDNATISGMYKFKSTLDSFPKLAGCFVPVTYSHNGKIYNAFCFGFYKNMPWHISQTGDGTSDNNTLLGLPYTSSNFTITDYTSNVIALFDKEKCENDSTYEPLTYITDDYTSYIDTVLDFGETPQDVPKIFKDWIESNFSLVYPYTYTVKSFAGDTVIGSITDAPSMKNAQISVIGKQKTLTLTGVNDVEYSITWESDTPEDTRFLGLSNAPNSDRPIVPVNVSTSVSWTGNITLYESYGTYRPPATPFDINLYQNSAEVNRVDKTDYFTGVGTLSGALREECSMLTPSIVYQSENVPTFNYVYIPIFNRYYFVTSLSSVSKNVWRMELNCDVLMTYKEQIFLLQGVIGRQENDYNPLLVDTEIPTQNNPIVEVIDIPSDAFNTQTSDSGHNFLITVIGA